MRELTLFFALITMVSFGVKAQDDDSDAEAVYQKGDNLFNAGFGLGYYGYGLLGTRTSSIPALEASFELGIHDYFGVGPYAGIVSWGYRDNFGFDGSFSIVTFGGRGSFHYKDLLEELLESEFGSDKLDLYVTMLFGLEFESYSGDFTQNNDVRVFIGPVLGARYYFTNNFGAYIEGGRGSFSFLKLGLTLKI